MAAMTGFFDWLGRVIMLVLAGMITLSIIGAIASIPSGTVATRIGVEPTAWPEPTESESRPLPPDARGRERPVAEAPPASQAPAAAQVRVEPAPKPPIDPVQWLEPIAYALLALVGLLAFGIILFWRALGYWRRSAEALEAAAVRSSGAI